MKKKIIIATITAFTLSLGATALAATSDSAKTIASKIVPASAEFTYVKDDGKEYDVYFRDTAQNTRYKVEVNKITDQVKEVSIKTADLGGQSIKISEEQVRNIIYKDYPDANIYKIETDYEHGKIKYEAKFTSSSIKKGEYEINAETGSVIEKSLKY